MKLFESSCSFNYPWSQVTAANWRKYPNEKSTHVVAVDVLRREVHPITGILRSERLITCEQKIPKWIALMVGGQIRSYVREVSEVDPVNQTLTMRSCNMTMNNILSVYEVVKYVPDNESPFSKTTFEQCAEIKAYSTFQRLTDKIEEWSIERFDSNAKLGKQGFESVLKIFSENLNKSGKLIDEYSEKLKASGKIIDGYSDKASVAISEVGESLKTGITDTSSLLYKTKEKIKHQFFGN
ncbi:hypothetical protein PACTADRAFT_63555 [Pachysolen tannophilus NRRL Y-2460]|uniref:PRELI/MSF1 domain-containing protein n=1 Tax=Pachysolen tannophilus NRRL Y-2460 TaxID=669874 RepID=A0A1E4U1L9_PACTA|nr:hypothetical protein PACTADRAFT_63555 [Pachysolen tannophilus NRRL Y-2460]